MATTRIANAQWQGSLQQGAGTVSFDSSGLGTFDVTWPSRAETPQGRTSPEEMIAAAHATCFSMALSHTLGQQSLVPQRVSTRAEVDFQPGQGITEIRLFVRAQIDGADNTLFQEAARTAKENCPVSKALAGTTVTLEATLE